MSAGRPALSLGDEGVQLVHLQRPEVSFLLALRRQGGCGQIGGGGVDPVGDRLRVDTQVPGDAPEVGAVHIQLERLAAHGQVMALRLGRGRMGAPAVAVLAAGGAGFVPAGTVLFGGCPAGGADQ